MRKKMLVIDIMTKEAIKEVLLDFVSLIIKAGPNKEYKQQINNKFIELMIPLTGFVEDISMCPFFSPSAIPEEDPNGGICNYDSAECLGGLFYNRLNEQCRLKFFEENK